MKRYPKDSYTSSNFDWKKIKWTKFKIVVPTKADEKELREAFRHIHDANIDTGYITVNQLAHLYAGDEGDHIVVDKAAYETLTKQTDIVKIKLKYKGSFLDGGTIIYNGSDGKSYYEDHRLQTKTKGALYDKDPDHPSAKMLNWQDFEKEKS